MDKGATIPPEVYAELRAWVEATSGRAVARAIGIGHSTFHDLLNGRAPRSKVRGRVLDWYANRPPEIPRFRRRAPDLQADTAEIQRAREYIRQRVEETSLRAQARAMNINHNSLAKFVGGAVPNVRTRGLLVGWYREHGKGDADAADTAYRNVTVDELREFYRRITGEDGLRLVAQVSGVRRNTLGKFVNGSEPFAQTHRLLALYYLYEKKKGPVKRQQIRQAQKRAKEGTGAQESLA